MTLLSKLMERLRKLTSGENRILQERNVAMPTHDGVSLLTNFLKLEPGFSSEDIGRKLPFKDPAISDRIVDSWKKAGLP